MACNSFVFILTLWYVYFRTSSYIKIVFWSYAYWLGFCGLFPFHTPINFVAYKRRVCVFLPTFVPYYKFVIQISHLFIYLFHLLIKPICNHHDSMMLIWKKRYHLMTICSIAYIAFNTHINQTKHTETRSILFYMFTEVFVRWRISSSIYFTRRRRETDWEKN